MIYFHTCPFVRWPLQVANDCLEKWLSKPLPFKQNCKTIICWSKTKVFGGYHTANHHNAFAYINIIINIPIFSNVSLGLDFKIAESGTSLWRMLQPWGMGRKVRNCGCDMTARAELRMDWYAIGQLMNNRAHVLGDSNFTIPAGAGQGARLCWAQKPV